MQHTPGPWDYEPYEDSPPESAIIGGVYQIAVVGYDDAEYSNARLIAAAPDLLAACEVAKIAVTDTITVGNRCDGIKDKLVVLGVAGLLGDAIHRIHHNESVSALFKSDPGVR